MVGHWWVVVVDSHGCSWHSCMVVGCCGWLSSGCHVAPGGCQKGGWEGGCACLPGLGTTSSPSSLPAINQVCVLGAGDVVLWRRSCGVVGGW